MRETATGQKTVAIFSNFWLLDSNFQDLVSKKGAIAQRLEQGAHNALAGGSNPSRPTILRQKITLVPLTCNLSFYVQKNHA